MPLLHQLLRQPQGQNRLDRQPFAALGELHPVLHRQLGLPRAHFLTDQAQQDRGGLVGASQRHRLIPVDLGRLPVLRVAAHDALELREGLLGATLLGGLHGGLDTVVGDRSDLALHDAVHPALFDVRHTQAHRHQRAEGEASHVRPVGDAGATHGVDLLREPGRQELAAEPERQHQPGRGREGEAHEDEPDQVTQLRAPEAHQECAHAAGHRTRRAHQGRLQVGEAAHEQARAGQPGQQVEAQEDRPPPLVLDEGTGQEQQQQVAEQVPPAAVQEHVPERPGEGGVSADQAPAEEGVRCADGRGLLDLGVELRLLLLALEAGRRQDARLLAQGHEPLALLLPVRAEVRFQFVGRHQVRVLGEVLHRLLNLQRVLTPDVAIGRLGDQEDTQAGQHQHVRHPRVAPHGARVVADGKKHGSPLLERVLP